jgi:predicted DNA-binding transcriptional regulator YafY
MGTSPPFGQGRARSKDEPSLAAFRKIALLVDLVRHRTVVADTYQRKWSINARTLQRDLTQLRRIGARLGFRISSRDNSRIELTSFERPARRTTGDAAEPLIARLGAAFGEPLLRQLGELATDGDANTSFLHFAAPLILDGSRVADVTNAVRDAMRSESGPCRMRFRYIGRDGTTSERTVEPAHITVRSGRYYLVAYDVDRRAWRVFALDMIDGTPRRAGSIAQRRPVPAAYANDDAIGFIRGGERVHDVVVEIAAPLAASVASRVWQERQIVQHLPNGRARITLHVTDPAEVVRWAFGFAPDARIVAPPDAVRLAAQLAHALAREHGESESAAFIERCPEGDRP